MTVNGFRVITIGATNSTLTAVTATNYSDIDSPTGYSDYTDTIAQYTKLQNTINDIYYEIINNPGLLYKNWLTIDEWLMELRIASIYRKLKAYSGYHQTVFRLRTVKGTSPIRRNRPGGRK